MKKNLCLWITSLFLMLLCAGGSRADDALTAPQQILFDTSERLKNALQDKTLKDDFPLLVDHVIDVVEAHVDFNRVSALVLGKYWRTADAGQKKRFQAEFKNLLVRTYVTALKEFTESDNPDWSLRFSPMKLPQDARKATVKTKINRSKDKPISVDYRMVNNQGEWKVYDIVIEGISLVTTYRSSFISDIEKTGSLDKLIEQIGERNTERRQSPAKES